MFIQDFTGEYQRYFTYGTKAIAQISEEALNHVPVAGANSIAMIVRHVSGNLKSRFTEFLTSDGEKEWRNRDDEFADGSWTRADVDRAWAAGFEVVDRELGKLTDGDLTKTVTIRGVSFTVHEALCRSIAHTASHTGQIVLLAKIAAGADWQTLSIPKNGSAAYNQNPVKEKAHRR
jgi:hypothetical protein